MGVRDIHHFICYSSLAEAGIHVAAGDLGENFTCKGLQVLDLPLHTKLRAGSTAVHTVTGALTWSLLAIVNDVVICK